MELSIIIEDKKGVINITSEQFIIEDLKAHICSKMGLEQKEYKVAVKCGLNPSLELIRIPSLKMEEPKQQEPKYYDLKTTHPTAMVLKKCTSLRLGYANKKVYQLNNDKIRALEKYMFSKHQENDSVIYYNDVEIVMSNQLLNYWGNPLLDYTKQEKRIRKSILNHVWDNRRIDVDVIQFSKDMNNIYIGFKNTRADFKPLIIHDLGNPILSFSHRDFNKDEVKEIAQLIASNF